MITAVLAAVFISIGMRGYARLQKICFYGGMVGLLIIFGLLIFHSKSEFQRGVQPLRASARITRRRRTRTRRR